MKFFAKRFAVISLFIVLTATWAAAQQKVIYSELPNFHQVNEQLYRGAQPRKAGLQKLSELGIKTIINLREEDARSRAGKAEAEAAGLRYFNMPMPAWGRPTVEQVNQVLELIQEPANWPVFIHCKRGADRTGTVVACYRFSHDGWSVAQAMAEAQQNGMHWIQYWMKGFIADYARHNALVGPGRAQRTDKEVVTLDEGIDDKIGSRVRVVELFSRRRQATVTSFLKELLD